MTELREMELLSRNAALGMRFWDVADGNTAIADLRVEVFPRANPAARTVAQCSRSGVYVAHALSGLRDFEFSDEDPDALWATATRPYRVEVSDPSGRYLPIAFDADAPTQGLFTWLAPWSSPPRPIALPTVPASPPQPLLERVPLFSSPARPVPEPLAVLYAHMRELGSNRVADWALLGVTIDGAMRSLGLADREGRVAVMFPYPEPPRMSLASPPEARNDFTWEVTLSTFWQPASPPQPKSPFADLATILASLASQRAVVESVASPAMPLRLTYREALTARTAGAADADASFLFVS